MQKSKLELYEEILLALVDQNLSVDNVAFLCNVDCATAAELLGFLEKNRLVENNHSYIKVLYSLTARGEAVYKTLTKTKRLNKLKESIKTIKETKPTLPLSQNRTKESNQPLSLNHHKRSEKHIQCETQH
jgi:predicted transcriptional regulator